MKNLAPSRALTRRSNQLKTLAFVVAAVGIFLVALGILLRVINLFAPSSSSYPAYDFIRTIILIGGVIVLIVAAGMAIRAFTWKTDNDLAMQVSFALNQQLNDPTDRFTLIRNISRHEIGYVDAVLVGPPGVLVFRILDNVGIFANEGSNWLRQVPAPPGQPAIEYKPAGIDATHECIADIEKMRVFLASHNLADVPVYGIIVFTVEAPRTQLMARQPVVPITPLSVLRANLLPNYLAKDRIDPVKAKSVADLLFGTPT